MKERQTGPEEVAAKEEESGSRRWRGRRSRSTKDQRERSLRCSVLGRGRSQHKAHEGANDPAASSAHYVARSTGQPGGAHFSAPAVSDFAGPGARAGRTSESETVRENRATRPTPPVYSFSSPPFDTAPLRRALFFLLLFFHPSHSSPLAVSLSFSFFRSFSVVQFFFSTPPPSRSLSLPARCKIVIARVISSADMAAP